VGANSIAIAWRPSSIERSSAFGICSAIKYSCAEVRAQGRVLGTVALAAMNEHERHTAAAIVDVPDFELTRPDGGISRFGGFPFYLLLCHSWLPLSKRFVYISTN
jgi:hypothetical protein